MACCSGPAAPGAPGARGGPQRDRRSAGARAVDSAPLTAGGDGAVLSVGTVGLLAGAGGAAKTTLALQIAVAAAATPDGAAGEACGGALIVADGPVVVATYEDALPVLRDRVLRMVERGAHLADGLDRLHLLDLAGWPLYGPADGMGYSAPPSPAGGWAPLWSAVEATGARLVIVDPALAAFTGESNAAGPVRAFIGALAREAAKRRAAVLLIAHSSKAARGKDRGKDADPYDPGQIGGSSHWADGARGALSLTRDAAAPDRHRLAVVKANYGPSMVSTDLAAARTPGGALVGLDARDGATWQHGAPGDRGPPRERRSQRQGRRRHRHERSMSAAFQPDRGRRDPARDCPRHLAEGARRRRVPGQPRADRRGARRRRAAVRGREGGRSAQ